MKKVISLFTVLFISLIVSNQAIATDMVNIENNVENSNESWNEDNITDSENLNSPIETPVKENPEEPVDPEEAINSEESVDSEEPVDPEEPIKEYRERIVDREIDFEVIYKEDSALEKGKEVIEQEGLKGFESIVYSDLYIDGVLTESKEIKRDFYEPFPKIIRIGTLVVDQDDESDEPVTEPTSPTPEDNPDSEDQQIDKKPIDTNPGQNLEDNKENEQDVAKDTITIVETQNDDQEMLIDSINPETRDNFNVKSYLTIMLISLAIVVIISKIEDKKLALLYTFFKH